MIKPRDYQIECVNAILNYFYSGNKGNPIAALPTGTGKSIIIAMLIELIVKTWPGQRIMMLTHVKELIVQNKNKLDLLWPTAPVGVYSAGLRLRDAQMPIVFGGVASVAGAIKRWKKTYETESPFGFRDLIIVDECDLVGPNENADYNIVISHLKDINPNLRVIGLSATPYRTKNGTLIGQGIFTDTCFDATSVSAFNRFIEEGYLAMLIPRQTSFEVDTSNFKVIAGEYSKHDVSVNIDTYDVTYKAVTEAIRLGADRSCWLVFANSVEHSEHVSEVLNMMGISASFTHSKMPAHEATLRLENFKAGKFQALVNVGKLTTGFDHPPIDLILMLRPTLSPRLWVQMLGRGTRPSPETGKMNCLVLDFVGNTKRLGPINDPVLPKKGKGKKGDAPIKICDKCGVYNHATAKICIGCGREFIFENKILDKASEHVLVKTEEVVIETFKVTKVLYSKHNKEGSPPSLKVSYFSGLKCFKEWVPFEGKEFARRKATNWWLQRHASPMPTTVDEVLTKISELRVPERISVRTDQKYAEIVSVEW